MRGIGQEPRPSMRGRVVRERGDRRRLATTRWDALKRTIEHWREDNDVGTIPGTTVAGCCVTHLLRWATGERNAFQLAPGKESNPPAVGRPERVAGAIGARQRACR